MCFSALCMCAFDGTPFRVSDVLEAEERMMNKRRGKRGKEMMAQHTAEPFVVFNSIKNENLGRDN